MVPGESKSLEWGVVWTPLGYALVIVYFKNSGSVLALLKQTEKDATLELDILEIT